jgi:putative addiction module antidote
MAIVKLITVGSSTGVILSDELLNKWRVRAGDHLHLIETERGFELSPCDSELQRQLSIAESVLQQDRETLKKLAE